MALHDRKYGGSEFPGISDEAERVERVSRFLLEAAERYAKVMHLAHIVRRDDPKVIDFSEARAKAAAEESSGARARKEAEGS